MAKTPVALTHPDLKGNDPFVAPSESVAAVLRKSGWKDAPKSEQPAQLPAGK